MYNTTAAHHRRTCRQVSPTRSNHRLGFRVSRRSSSIPVYRTCKLAVKVPAGHGGRSAEKAGMIASISSNSGTASLSMFIDFTSVIRTDDRVATTACAPVAAPEERGARILDFEKNGGRLPSAPPSLQRIREAQQADAAIKQIIQVLTTEPTTKAEQATRTRHESRYWYVTAGVGQPKLLYLRPAKESSTVKAIPATVILIPSRSHRIQHEIVAYVHNCTFGGVHPGVKSTEQAVRSQYFWHNIRETVTTYVAGCTMSSSVGHCSSRATS